MNGEGSSVDPPSGGSDSEIVGSCDTDSVGSFGVDRLGLDSTFWAGWSKKQIDSLKEILDYHAKVQAFIKDILINGPSSNAEPKKPTITYKQILNLSKTQKSKAQKNNKIARMTDEEFISHLEILLKPNKDESTITSKMPTANLEIMGNYLKVKYDKIKGKETELLNNYLQYGDDLCEARSKFGILKAKSKCKETWEQWIETNTTICYSMVKRYIQMSRFVKEYPKLKKLQVSFTALFEMKRKIEQVFKNKPDLSKSWKE